MSDLKNEIHDYWTNRARGYSEYNQQEMADARQTMWRAKLLDLLGKQFPEREPKEIKILYGSPARHSSAHCHGKPATHRLLMWKTTALMPL